MANQVDPETVSGTTLPPGQAGGETERRRDDAPVEPEPGYTSDPGHAHASYHGRPVSWAAATTILIGFVVGGFALVFGPTWPVFWIGAGIVVVGSVLATLTDMFDDWY